jgi:hypothetical protein
MFLKQPMGEIAGPNFQRGTSENIYTADMVDGIQGTAAIILQTVLFYKPLTVG